MALRRLRLLIAVFLPLWAVWFIPVLVEAHAPRVPALGSPFVVNAVNDAAEYSPGDGICETASGNGICTLRAAIQEANLWPGEDTILISALIPTPTTFLLTRSGSDNTGVNGDLDVVGDLIISGRGPLATIIDAGGMITRDYAIEIRPGARLTLTGLTVQDAGDGSHAAIHNIGRLYLDGSIVQDNWGDGISVEDFSTLIVRNSVVRDNNGQGIDVALGGMAVLSGSLLSGNTSGAISLFHASGLTITASDLISNGNPVLDRGGAIYVRGTNVLIADSRIQGNRAGLGAGISINDGNVRIRNSRLVGNVSTGEGGAIHVADGALTVDQSTIADNQATTRGGGIANFGALTVTASAVLRNLSINHAGGFFISTTAAAETRIVNSTLSLNRANSSGGGIYLLTGTVHLSNTTVYTNVADDNYNNLGTGGGVYQAGGTLYLRASILARNRLRENVNLYVQDDCAGTVQSLNYNYIGDTGGCTILGATSFNITGTSFTLGPLGVHGGPTETHVPPRGSRVIDAGTNSACPSTDQRGTPRPLDGNGNGQKTCDMGAVEYVPDMFLPAIAR